MVKYSIAAIFCLIVWAGCGIHKKVMEVPLVPLVEKKDLSYTFISSEIVGDTLVAKLQYGGGCVKPHQFSLVQTPRVEKGEVNIWLKHTTYDDKCKALVRTEQKFSIASLLKDATITSIKLNGEKEMLNKKEEDTEE
jgi:hypothetical protein